MALSFTVDQVLLLREYSIVLFRHQSELQKAFTWFRIDGLCFTASPICISSKGTMNPQIYCLCHVSQNVP